MSPEREKVTIQFYNYFGTRWLEGSKFPSFLWNHYETIEPRSNNHSEGYKFTLNNEIYSVHPNIVGLIGTLKEQDVLNSIGGLR